MQKDKESGGGAYPSLQHCVRVTHMTADSIAVTPLLFRHECKLVALFLLQLVHCWYHPGFHHCH